MRVIFMATGDIALPAFRRLLERGPRPLALVTQPDKPVGRHQTLMAPAVKLEALAAGVPVLQPTAIKDAAADLAALDPDVIAVMAYGQILPDAVLAIPRLAFINLHASLLPRHRGASCIQSAIAAGDPTTGVTAMHVVRKLDSGDIILAKSLPIRPDDTGATLHQRLAELAPEVLTDTLRHLAAGTAPRTPQDEALATYAPKLDRNAGRIDWSRPAECLERQIRAYDPWPGCHTMADTGGLLRRLKIFPPVEVCPMPLPPGVVLIEADRLVIGCGVGALRVCRVQPDGSRRMITGDYLRGHQPLRME